MKKLFLSILMLTFVPMAAGAVVTETVTYQHGDANLIGHLAYDDAATEKRPGILVVHEWKGLNEYAKGRAEQLAELGFVAFAIDMYGDGKVAKDHKEAGQLAGLYRGDRELMRARARAGYEVLANHASADSSKLAAIGYCFGGSTVIEMARAGFDLQGVASFHGGLDAPIKAVAGDVKAKVIAFHGAQDKFISEDEIKGFKEEMTAADVDWQFIEFGDAVHSFTVPAAGNDPSKGMAYHRDADVRSWAMLLDFFEEIFQ